MVQAARKSQQQIDAEQAAKAKDLVQFYKNYGDYADKYVDKAGGGKERASDYLHRGYDNSYGIMGDREFVDNMNFLHYPQSYGGPNILRTNYTEFPHAEQYHKITQDISKLSKEQVEALSSALNGKGDKDNKTASDLNKDIEKLTEGKSDAEKKVITDSLKEKVDARAKELGVEVQGQGAQAPSTQTPPSAPGQNQNDPAKQKEAADYAARLQKAIDDAKKLSDGKGGNDNSALQDMAKDVGLEKKKDVSSKGTTTGIEKDVVDYMQKLKEKSDKFAKGESKEDVTKEEREELQKKFDRLTENKAPETSTAATNVRNKAQPDPNKPAKQMDSHDR